MSHNWRNGYCTRKSTVLAHIKQTLAKPEEFQWMNCVICWLLFLFSCSAFFSLITVLNVFAILTGLQRCHKNFPVWWKSHTTLFTSTILKQTCPPFWWPIAAHENSKHLLEKIPLLTLTTFLQCTTFCTCISSATGNSSLVELLSQHTIFSNLLSQELLSALSFVHSLRIHQCCQNALDAFITSVCGISSVSPLLVFLLCSV